MRQQERQRRKDGKGGHKRKEEGKREEGKGRQGRREGKKKENTVSFSERAFIFYMDRTGCPNKRKQHLLLLQWSAFLTVVCCV